MPSCQTQPTTDSTALYIHQTLPGATLHVNFLDTYAYNRLLLRNCCVQPCCSAEGVLIHCFYHAWLC